MIKVLAASMFLIPQLNILPITKTSLIVNVFNFQQSKQFAYGFAEEVRKLDFGAVTPGYDFMKTLRYLS